jgi:hypothetical protein
MQGGYLLSAGLLPCSILLSLRRFPTKRVKPPPVSCAADIRRNGAKDDTVESLHDIGIETDVDPPEQIRPNPILSQKTSPCGHGGSALAAIIGCRMKERKYGH